MALVDGAGAPVRPPLAGAETKAGGRQYWASGVCGLGVPGAETDGGGPRAHRRILRPDGPADRAGPVPEGDKTRLPREERRVVGYSENVLKQLKVTIVNSVKVVVEPYK